MRAGLVSVLSGFLLWVALPQAATADVLISVDKTSQRMEVTVDGRPRYSWPVSTGVASYDTPSGSYRPFRMERTHFSKEWDDAPMPFAMFFTNQGHAIHGTNHVRSLGRAASHGCVRLSVRNAATLFNLVKAEGIGRTRVEIEGEGALVADRGQRGLRVARHRNPYAPDDAFADVDQMGRSTLPATYRSAARPAYAPVTGYGYPADTDVMDGW
ncbi:L,D-transpeptidase [Methylobacterium sp. NEAU K]|uniref:L,D-transpeptidase n=1 Tax=Methylobacterium sp. NEAU K TaxID=3064946 RepID=UPI002735D80E|nr:L,D-transpeptidase [Methylobacterium sp. NEAU K]MDP4005752.1 L,D-transpeptidase [Methylobacterium sp. NEAU K]